MTAPDDHLDRSAGDTAGSAEPTTALASVTAGATVADHTTEVAAPRRRRRRWPLAVLAVVALLGIGIGAVAASTAAWGDGLRDDGRLLAGITIAGVDVSGHTTDEAIAAVEAALAPRLDHEVAVTTDGRSWTVTPRELGATADTTEVVAEAFEATTSASLLELARLRYRDAQVALDLDVTTRLPDDAVRTQVDAMADEVDLEPTDAELTWVDGGPQLTDHATGRRVDRDATAAALSSALDGTQDTVELPVDVRQPALTTELAQTVSDTTVATIDAALDRVATVTHEGQQWTVTPRDLGAVPDAEPVLDAAFEHVGAPRATPAVAGTGNDAAVLDVAVPLELPDDAVAGFVAEIAGGIDQPARDATVDLVGDRLEVTPERTGTAVDRDDVGTALRAALDGSGSTTVELTLVTTRPSVTSDSLGMVLLLRQGARTVELYENGEVTRSWPVAVGAGGHPTPTGTFTVGAKRFEPTWTNPSPDGWGEDMPASVGPGDPANPLGLRALNWNRNGADTLIRFHGTPNEASIGQAVSKGCVRMYNADVAELFDLVPTGTTIISVA